MALIRVPIGADGPVIDLGIWLARALAHALVAQGQTVPSPRTIRALIDTGADRTAIHPKALASIASPPSGTTLVHRPVPPPPLGGLTFTMCVSRSVGPWFPQHEDHGSRLNPLPSFPPTPVSWR